MLSELLKSPVALSIMQCAADQARLALRLRIFVYPDDVCAVWLMIASRHRPAPLQ